MTSISALALEAKIHALRYDEARAAEETLAEIGRLSIASQIHLYPLFVKKLIELGMQQ